MITEGQPRTFRYRNLLGRSPFAAIALTLGVVLALVFGFLGTHSFVTDARAYNAPAILPASVTAPQNGELVAGSALHAELLSGPQTACAQPCVIPSPAPAQDDATLLMLCALAMLVTLALLAPPLMKRLRDRSNRNALRSAAIALNDTNRTPSPPGIHLLSVCRT